MHDTTGIRVRLWANTRVDPSTGCWTWTGRLDRGGYGKIQHDGRTRQVHRLAAELMAAPFDPGLTIDHLCRNRACWNPAHLEAVSNRTNILRGVGPTAMNAAKTHCVNGHELTPDNIRRRPGDRAHHRECLACHRARERARRKARRSSAA